jgi:D-lyxose isomerase
LATPRTCLGELSGRTGVLREAHVRSERNDYSCTCARQKEGRYHLSLREAGGAGWASKRPLSENKPFGILLTHEEQTVTSGSTIELDAGWRVTLVPGVYHECYPFSDECTIGEVSTDNDDFHDNFFVDPRIGVTLASPEA